MVVTRKRTILQKWKFHVNIDGINEEPATFSKAGPLQAEAAVLEHHAGGAYIPYKAPGKGSFPNITLERGLTDNRDLYEWFEQVVDASANFGLDAGLCKRNMTIVQEDRKGIAAVSFRIWQAFPVVFVAGDWDGSANEFSIESVELAYDYFQRIG